jgi:hypothetical protein
MHTFCKILLMKKGPGLVYFIYRYIDTKKYQAGPEIAEIAVTKYSEKDT